MEAKTRFNSMGMLTQATQNFYDQAHRNIGMGSLEAMSAHYNFMSEAEKNSSKYGFAMTEDILSKTYREFETSKFNLMKDIDFLDLNMSKEFKISKAFDFNLLQPLVDTAINGLKRMQVNYQVPNNYLRAPLALNTANFEALNNMEMLINKSISTQINDFLNPIGFQRLDDLNRISKLIYDQIDFHMESSLEVSNFIKQVNKNIKYSETENDIIPVSTLGTITEREVKLFVLVIFLLPVIFYYGNPENINDLISLLNSFYKHLTGYISGETFGFAFNQLKRLYKGKSIGEMKMVIRDNAAIRHKPNVFAEIITRVKYEEFVKIQEDKNGWLLVQVLNRDLNYAGFIKKEYVGKISI